MNHQHHNNNNTAMEKFQKLIFKIADDPNTPLTPAAKSLVQDRLNQFISQYKTPDHPPYSAMIERALRELNEKGGSSEKSISQFLEKNYKDLPWAHLSFVKHHLGRLCECGDIILTGAKKYMCRGEDPTSVQSSSKRKPRSKRKVRWDWERDRNKRRKRKRNPLKDEKLEVTENHWESDVQQNRASEYGVGDEEDRAKWLKAEHAEDDKPSELEVTENHWESDVQQNGVSENGVGDEQDRAKRSKAEHAEDDKPSELPTTPERPPGFESVIEEDMLNLPLKMWNLASYTQDSIKQSKETSIEKSSSYEHEKQLGEILVSDQ